MTAFVHLAVWLNWLINAAGLFLLFAIIYAVWRYQTARRMKDDPDFANHRLAARYFAQAMAEHRRGREISARAYYEMACELDPDYRARRLGE